MTEVLNVETGELIDTDEAEEDETPEPEPAPEPESEGRCEAETTVGGTLYRCALDAEHAGDHSFTPMADTPPAVEDTEKTLRVRGEKLDRENERHWKRIQEVMEEDALDLVPCELCFVKTPGYRWNTAPNEETAARVRIAIGLPDVSNFAPSATERQCDDCRGLGRVRTGSTVPKKETATCDACAGNGYVASRPRLNADASAPAPDAATDSAAPIVDDGIERDMFGTPATDPDFGKMPNMRARPVDYWQTNRA